MPIGFLSVTTMFVITKRAILANVDFCFCAVADSQVYLVAELLAVFAFHLYQVNLGTVGLGFDGALNGSRKRFPIHFGASFDQSSVCSNDNCIFSPVGVRKFCFVIFPSASPSHYNMVDCVTSGIRFDGELDGDREVPKCHGLFAFPVTFAIGHGQKRRQGSGRYCKYYHYFFHFHMLLYFLFFVSRRVDERPGSSSTSGQSTDVTDKV